MQTWIRPTLGSYLMTGLISVLASHLLSGCRIGNRVEKQPRVETISGLYNTKPARLIYCVKTEREECAAANSVTPVPDDWDQIVTDPVYVGSFKSDPTQGLMINVNDLSVNKPRGVALTITSPSSFNYLQALAPVRLDCDVENDPSCADTTAQGCFNKVTYSGSGTVFRAPAADYDGLPVSGSLQLGLKRAQEFQGSCTGFLSDIQSCYEDASQCGGASDQQNAEIQDTYKTFFNDWTARGILTSAQIPLIRELGYILSYE